MEAAAMDFHTLPRRELQALCKRNGIRANITNAAMADALQSLSSVDGVDEIGTTLCLPTPGRSALKSAVKAVVGEEQQGSPLPRGRRVSVKSPEAIKMHVEEEEEKEGLKRDPVKEIVRTPGVGLRSSSRLARATPIALTPVASNVRTTRRKAAACKTEEERASTVLPTPTTLRRSQRSAAWKAVKGQGVVSTRKRAVAHEVMMDLDEEVVVAAAAVEEKVQEEEPKGVVSDEKCDDLKEEEARKRLEEQGSKNADEPEAKVEAVASDVLIGSACDDPKELVGVVVEDEATKHRKIVGIGEEEAVIEVSKNESIQEQVIVEHCASVPSMEDSPILGLVEATEEVDVSVGYGEDVSEGKEVAVSEVPLATMADEEAIKVDDFTVEIDHANEEEKEVLTSYEMPQVAVTDDEATDEDDLTGNAEHVNGEKEEVVDDMPHVTLTDDEATDEDGLTGNTEHVNGEKEEAVHDMPHVTLTADEAVEEVDLSSGANHVNVEKKEAMDGMLQATVTADKANEENDITHEINHVDQEKGAMDEMPQATVTVDVAIKEDGLTGEINLNKEEELTVDEKVHAVVIPNEVAEKDDFTSDLPLEFDNAGNFSDTELEGGITSPVLEEAQVTLPSPAKSSPLVDDMLDAVVRSLDECVITADLEVSSEEAPVQAEVTEGTKQGVCAYKNGNEKITKGTKQEGVEANGKQVKTSDFGKLSMRKLRKMIKTREEVIAAKAAEGKRLALAEVDDNVC